MKRALRGILLDLDETLYSREEAFWNWLTIEARTASASETLDRSEVAALDQRGRGNKHELLRYLDSVFMWGQTHEQRLQRFQVGIAAAARLAPGVRESLDRIAAHYKIGLVSNGTGATQRAKLRALSLDNLFDPIVISEEVGVRKPDAKIFELALAGWSIPPASVLFVGDDPVSDIAGATAAGLRTLQVAHEHGIPSILELEQWLQDHAVASRHSRADDLLD
jgi:putative hydrolase of the HAD superfamily